MEETLWKLNLKNITPSFTYPVCVCMHMFVCTHAHKLNHVWLCNPMDCSLPGSSVHGISQARVLNWFSIPYSIHILWLQLNKNYVGIKLLGW